MLTTVIQYHKLILLNNSKLDQIDNRIDKEKFNANQKIREEIHKARRRA